MLKRLAALLAILLLAGNLSAGDPWKDKSYKQWDEKDIRRVLTDSPWAREVRVDATWLGPGGNTAVGGGGGGGGYGTGGGMMGGGPSSGRPEGSQGVGAQQVSFTVRWVSSRTVRQALARAAVLRGTPEAEADQTLASDPSDYVVLVVGRDMTPFAKADENGLKEKSSLWLKKTKVKLVPSRVEIQRPRPDQPQAENTSGVVFVLFYFAKKTAAGEAALPTDEKSVEFVCQAGGTSIRTSFELQKMAGPLGLDW